MTSPLVTLVRSVTNPAAEDTYNAAWGLDFGTDGTPRVNVLATASALPRRLPFPDELFLWFGAPMSKDWEPLLSHLDEAVRNRVGRLRRPEDRWSVAAAHAGLRILLARMLRCSAHEIMFTSGISGKLTLAMPPGAGIYFNISHTEGLVAVALAGRPVGVDVERVRELTDMQLVAETAFANEALVALANANSHAARTALFFRFWTLGEAFIKTTGRGLAQGLKTFAFNADGEPHLVRVNDAWSPRTRWRFGIFAHDRQRQYADAITRPS